MASGAVIFNLLSGGPADANTVLFYKSDEFTWLSGAVGKASDFWSEGRRFEPHFDHFWNHFSFIPTTRGYEPWCDHLWNNFSFIPTTPNLPQVSPLVPTWILLTPLSPSFLNGSAWVSQESIRFSTIISESYVSLTCFQYKKSISRKTIFSYFERWPLDSQWQAVQ